MLERHYDSLLPVISDEDLLAEIKKVEAEVQKVQAKLDRLQDEWARREVEGRHDPEVSATKRGALLCTCGHGSMVHVSSCFVAGCKCKQLTTMP
jgi:hypothetical protein